MGQIGHLELLMLVRCMVRSLRIGFGKLVWLLTEGGAGMWMVRWMIGRLLMLGMLGMLGIGLSRIGRAVGWIKVGVREIAGLRMEGHVVLALKASSLPIRAIPYGFGGQTRHQRCYWILAVPGGCMG